MHRLLNLGRIVLVFALFALPGHLNAQQCIPSYDITCDCDPSVDPVCGCDPNDPTCGGTICDPTSDPTCGLGCDPTTDPSCIQEELIRICDAGKGAQWAQCMFDCYHRYDIALDSCDWIIFTGWRARCRLSALTALNDCAFSCRVSCNS